MYQVLQKNEISLKFKSKMLKTTPKVPVKYLKMLTAKSSVALYLLALITNVNNVSIEVNSVDRDETAPVCQRGF